MVLLRMLRHLVIVALAAAVLPAQDAPAPTGAEKRRPPRHVRVLPVGESPPYRQEVRDGVRYELPPPSGSVPPREVSYLGADGQAAGSVLRLGMVGEPIPVPEGPSPVVLRDGPASALDAPPWIVANLPETGDALLGVWRAGEGWAKPRWLVLGDGPEACPAGTVRLVNVSPAEIALEAGPIPRTEVGPGQVARLPVGVAAEVPFRLSYHDPRDGTWRQFRSSALAQGGGERTTFVVFRADGAQPAEPLKTVILRERAPVVPASAP